MSKRLIAALFLTFALTFTVAVVVLGHAELVSSDPPADGSLETTPYTLNATFDDGLDGASSSIVVRNAAGDEVASGGVSAANDTVMTAELPALEPGDYTVRWTAVTSDDAAVERGSYTFSVGPGATPPPGSGQPSGTANDLLIALALAGLVLVAVFAFVFVRRRR